MLCFSCFSFRILFVRNSIICYNYDKQNQTLQHLKTEIFKH